MLGALFFVRHQLVCEVLIFFRCFAPRPRAGNRADGHSALAQTHENLRARSDDREVGKIQEVEERRGIEPAQGAIEREGRKRERAPETLAWNDLEDIAGADVLLGRLYDPEIFGVTRVRFRSSRRARLVLR